MFLVSYLLVSIFGFLTQCMPNLRGKIVPIKVTGDSFAIS